MDELERAGRNLLANPMAQPSDLERIEARSAQIRRARRRAAVATAFVIVVLLGGAGALLIDATGGESVRPVNAGPTTTPPRVETPETSALAPTSLPDNPPADASTPPPIQATWLPDGFSSDLRAGSGGLITVGADGTIEWPDPMPGWWTWFASPGRFVDLRTGPPSAWYPSPLDPRDVPELVADDVRELTVLGRRTFMVPIEGGYLTELISVSGACDHYSLLGYGVTPDELVRFAEGLAEDERPLPVNVSGAPDQIIAGTDHGLMVLDASTGDEIAVIDGASPGDQCRVWSPSLAAGGSIYYWAENGTGGPALWRFSSEAGLSEPVVEQGTYPSVSPDGRHLAYVESHESEQGLEEVLVVRDLDDGTERRWEGIGISQETWSWPASIVHLDWHPDGDRIAFAVRFGFEREESEVRILALDEDESLADATPLAGAGKLTAPSYEPSGALLVVDKTICGPPPCVEPGHEQGWPVLRFDDTLSDPVREHAFDGLNSVEIHPDPTGESVLVRTTENDLYVVAADHQRPVPTSEEILAATW